MYNAGALPILYLLQLKTWKSELFSKPKKHLKLVVIFYI